MATLTSTPDSARINCRIRADIKRKAEEAAELLRQSITDFTESALAEKAQAVFERQERILLSERDFARFVALLDNPEPPTPQLAAAMRDYEQKKAQNPGGNW
jgi:uncharacterized protein (DUF1778 family)